MTNEDKYICQCCGGRINRRNMTCEYCGTQYKEEYNDVIRVETFRNPVERLEAHVVFTRDALEAYGNDVGEIARNEIARKLSNALTGLIRYDCEFNPASREYHVRGMAKVVIPKDKGNYFYERSLE